MNTSEFVQQVARKKQKNRRSLQQQRLGEAHLNQVTPLDTSKPMTLSSRQNVLQTFFPISHGHGGPEAGNFVRNNLWQKITQQKGFIQKTHFRSSKPLKIVLSMYKRKCGNRGNSLVVWFIKKWKETQIKVTFQRSQSCVTGDRAVDNLSALLFEMPISDFK